MKFVMKGLFIFKFAAVQNANFYSENICFLHQLNCGLFPLIHVCNIFCYRMRWCYCEGHLFMKLIMKTLFIFKFAAVQSANFYYENIYFLFYRGNLKYVFESSNFSLGFHQDMPKERMIILYVCVFVEAREKICKHHRICD